LCAVGEETIFLLTGLKEKEPGSSSSLYKSIKLAIVGSLTVHFTACVWFGLACSRIDLDFNPNMCSNESWLIHVSTGKDAATLFFCVKCIYIFWIRDSVPALHEVISLT